MDWAHRVQDRQYEAIKDEINGSAEIVDGLNSASGWGGIGTFAAKKDFKKLEELNEKRQAEKTSQMIILGGTGAAIGLVAGAVIEFLWW